MLWITVFKRFKKAVNKIIEVNEDYEIQLLATSMAFTTILSIVPLIAVSLAISKSMGTLGRFVQQFEPIVLRYLASGTGESFLKALESAIDRTSSRALGTTGFIFLAATAIKLLMDIDAAIQRVWKIKTQRPLWMRIILYCIIIVLGPGGLALLLGLLSPENFGILKLLPTRVFGFVFIFALLFIIFKFVPNTRVQAGPAVMASALTAVVLIGMQNLYAWATGNVLYYNKLYGSLATIPLFLIWILIIWIVLLTGTALCSALQSRKE